MGEGIESLEEKKKYIGCQTGLKDFELDMRFLWSRSGAFDLYMLTTTMGFTTQAPTIEIEEVLEFLSSYHYAFVRLHSEYHSLHIFTLSVSDKTRLVVQKLSYIQYKGPDHARHGRGRK